MKKFFLLLILIISQLPTQAQQKFDNLESLLAYADSKSIATNTGNIRLMQSKKTLLLSKLAILDPQINANANFINNTRLPVNIVPGEAFGGQEGTTRELQFGTQYNTSATQNLDVKLLNLEGWKNFKLAEINIQISENDIKLNQKNLHDNIASTYYNIVQLNTQLESTKQNLTIADSLLALAQRKYALGVVKQQDVNDSKVNTLNINENIRQIEFLIQQNYISLKILSDISETENIEITEKVNLLSIVEKPTIELNNLFVESNRLKELSALTTVQKTKRAITPSLSFVFNHSFNLYNNDFSVLSGNWIPSNYVGLKLNLPFPNSNTLSNKYKAKFDYQLAQKNTEQAEIKASLNKKQLTTDWEKSVSQVKNYSEILEIQKDTYAKNQNLYNEGLISIDRVLNSFNALTNTKYSLNSSQVSVLLAHAKININNKIK
ncbi:MAG: TolC family protein [Leadbetterella sp.]